MRIKVKQGTSSMTSWTTQKMNTEQLRGLRQLIATRRFSSNFREAIPFIQGLVDIFIIFTAGGSGLHWTGNPLILYLYHTFFMNTVSKYQIYDRTETICSRFPKHFLSWVIVSTYIYVFTILIKATVFLCSHRCFLWAIIINVLLIIDSACQWVTLFSSVQGNWSIQ